MTVGQVRKAIATAVSGALVWAGLVIDSPAPGVTAREWLAAGVLASGVLAVFGLANDPPPAPPADVDPTEG